MRIFQRKAEIKVRIMPENIPMHAVTRFRSVRERNCFLNPIKNPVEESTIKLNIAKRILNFLIRSKTIAKMDKNPENIPINAHPINPRILWDRVN